MKKSYSYKDIVNKWMTGVDSSLIGSVFRALFAVWESDLAGFDGQF